MSPWQMHLAPDSQLDHEPHPHRSLLLTRLLATSRVPARDQNGGDQHHGPLASRMEGAPHVDGNAKQSSGCAARLLQQHQIAMNSASPRKAKQGSRCAANRQMQPNLSRIIFQALPLLRKFHDELANDHRRALLTGWQRFASFPNSSAEIMRGSEHRQPPPFYLPYRTFFEESRLRFPIGKPFTWSRQIILIENLCGIAPVRSEGLFLVSGDYCFINIALKIAIPALAAILIFYIRNVT